MISSSVVGLEAVVENVCDPSSHAYASSDNVRGEDKGHHEEHHTAEGSIVEVSCWISHLEVFNGCLGRKGTKDWSMVGESGQPSLLE